MSEAPKIVGLVLAGGQSSRFGEPKALAELDGETLAARMARMLANGCEEVALSAREPLLGPGFPVLPDPPGLPAGPLAGVLAGLRWASALNAQWLVTAPCDTPLLPDDFTMQLVSAAERAGARVAVLSSSDGLHPLTAAWSAGLASFVEQALGQGHPPVHAFVESLGAAKVAVADEHLLNINTPADLERARQALATRY